MKKPPRANVANCVIVIGAFAPTVVTTMLPQFVSKVKVRANRLGSFSAGATDGGVCPTALVALHFIAGTFADLTDLPFASAKADGERINEIAITATTKRFTFTPLDIALMVNRNPVKTLKLFPFNGARWLASHIQDHSIYLADLIGYAGRNLFKNLVWNA